MTTPTATPLNELTYEESILVADDEAHNVELLTRILRRAGFVNVHTTTRPAEVFDLFARTAPDIVLLDLHMPEIDGVTVMRRIRTHAAPDTFLPIVVLTGDVTPEARLRTLLAGASDFITKPFDPSEILLRVRNLLQTRALHVALAARNRDLEERVRERTAALVESQVEVLQRLAAAVELRDGHVGEHIRRVGDLSAALWEAMGEGAASVDVVRRAATLHDIGKIGIPDHILRKPGRLTDEEMAVMKTHTVIGASILAGGSSDLVVAAERIARSHHERWDGRGYPDGLAAEAIPLTARVVAVADVFDALCSSRPYRPATPVPDVLLEIQRGAGTQFDPAVVDALLRVKAHEAAGVADAIGTGGPRDDGPLQSGLPGQ